jgi:unsaturated rhamnogalacturonyl hydrolase
MFWQVIDRPEDEGNYLETSGTALIAYALLKGARLAICRNVMAKPARKHSGNCRPLFEDQG